MTLLAVEAIIERDGVNALSMPNLGTYLGAGLMSVYWYFHSKDDLVLALADRAWLKVLTSLPAVTNRNWVKEVIGLSDALHEGLRENGLYLQLCRSDPRCLVLRPSVIPLTARRMESELRALQQGDVGAGEATMLLGVLGAFIRGFALMQVGAEQEENMDSAERTFQVAIEQLNPEKFPTLRGLRRPGKVVSVNDDSFEGILRLLVDGIPERDGSSPEFGSSTRTFSSG